MAQIPLLCAGLEKRGKTRKGRSGSLKIRERVGPVVILEVIVGGKFLRWCDAVIEAHGELIATHMPVAARDEFIVGWISL